MLYENDILNTETLDLNSRGMVVSMADGVATVAGLQDVLAGELVSLGEVQGLLMRLISKVNFCFTIFTCNLLNTKLGKENSGYLYIEYTHFFFWILLIICGLYVLISILYLILSSHFNYYLEYLYKSLIFLVITMSIFVVTSPNLLDNLKINYFDLINKQYENGNINYITIGILCIIPFLFFVLTIFFISYNVKLVLNNNYSSFLNNTWLYFLMWISSFYCLYKFGILNIILSIDKSIHSEFVSVFLTKFHFRIFTVSLLLPLMAFIFVVILKGLNFFKIDIYNKARLILNKNIQSIAFQKWYTRVTILLFVSILYAFINVYGSGWVKPFNLLYIYKDSLVILSSFFIFPGFNVGRIIFSGATVSRSGNFEVASPSAKKLVKNFHRQYSNYPKGSPQYRLMERKTKLFSKWTSKSDTRYKSLLDRITKVETSTGRIEGKVDVITDQTSFINGVKVGSTVTVGLGVAADLASDKPKIPAFIKESIKNVDIDSEKINT